MKRNAVIVLSGLILSICTVPAIAEKGNVAYTVHNLSNVKPSGMNMQRDFASSTESGICVFCHTPHHANPAKPLWNKSLPSQQFRMYTSSISLSKAAKSVTTPGPESLLCLSCHDGRTAINVVHNTRTPEAQGASPAKVVDINGVYNDHENPQGYGVAFGSFGLPSFGANLGKFDNANTDDLYGANLLDDHPISFSYQQAWNENKDKLYDFATVNAKSGGAIKFFGPEKRIECSSCHDPHVNYGSDRKGNTWTAGDANPLLRPFLVMDNSFSALCISCHIR